jgi:transketolase
MSTHKLKQTAKEIRRKVLRMICEGKHCHVGTSLSIVDLLAVLYFGVLNHDPKNPSHPDRDRLILSKGHGAAALYATLAEAGYFHPDELKGFVQDGSPLTGHVNYHGVPGVEFSSGSLGHGLSVGLGMALAAKKNKQAHKVYVILSDGELDEGSNWEAILAAANWGLDNLVVLVDYNKIQSFGRVEEVMPLEPLADKWRAFRWEVQEVNGHSFDELLPALRAAPITIGRPTVILAHTVKGKGVSFMEDKMEWHYLTPTAEQLAAAEKELDAYED